MATEFVGDIPFEVLQQGGFIGPRFTGVFFFEDVFWRVAIPLVYGRPTVNAINALRVMPAEMKQRLCSVRNTVREYLLLWADCFDYDTGFIDSHATFTAGSFLGEMIESTERELTSAIADLCQQHPNSKAMHSKGVLTLFGSISPPLDIFLPAQATAESHDGRFTVDRRRDLTDSP